MRLCCVARELDEKINIVSVHSAERLVQEVISQSKHKDCKQDQGQENDIQTSKTIPKNRTYHFTACISVHAYSRVPAVLLLLRFLPVKYVSLSQIHAKTNRWYLTFWIWNHVSVCKLVLICENWDQRQIGYLTISELQLQYTSFVVSKVQFLLEGYNIYTQLPSASMQRSCSTRSYIKAIHVNPLSL